MALIEGIISRFQANGTLSGAVAGPFLEEVPPNTAFPYCTIAEGMGQFTKLLDAFGSRFVEPTIVKFFIYGTNAVTISSTYLPALKTQFDRGSFSLSEGYLISSTRLKADTVHLDRGKVDKNGNAVYYSWSSYVFNVDRAHS